MLNATGPGRIAFSRDAAGETLAIPLHAGRTVDVREHLFMVATRSVQYDFMRSGVWFKTRNGDETETHYPLGWLLDRFSAPAEPGLLLIHAHGNAFLRELGPGETILIKPSAFLYKDVTVRVQLHFEHPATPGAELLAVGRALPVAAPRRPRPGRDPVGLRPHPRSRRLRRQVVGRDPLPVVRRRGATGPARS